MGRQRSFWGDERQLNALRIFNELYRLDPEKAEAFLIQLAPTVVSSSFQKIRRSVVS